MAVSQNGYTVPPPGGTFTWKVPGTNVLLPLRKGAVGFVLVWFALAFHVKVESLTKGHPRDDWGYAFRPVRGQTSGYSNHASGTAIDLNATQHPLGVRGTFAHAWQYVKIKALLARMRWVLRSGIQYHNRPDEMHVEVNRDTAAVAAVARRLVKTKRGKAILAANGLTVAQATVGYPAA